MRLLKIEEVLTYSLAVRSLISVSVDGLVRLDAGDCLALTDEIDVGLRWRRHPLTEEEARMWWFIIDHVLPSDRQPVLRIVHQRVDAVLSWDCRGIEP